MPVPRLTPYEMWMGICEAAPGVVIGGKKGLWLEEADLVAIGAVFEQLASCGVVNSRAGWPRGDLDEVGRSLPHGSTLYALREPGR